MCFAKDVDLGTAKKEIIGILASAIAVEEERNRVKEALSQSEERFRTIYENSTIGLYRATPDGNVILCNPALLKMLGFSSFEELSPRNLNTAGFEPPYERKHFLEQIEVQGEIKDSESAWTRVDGTILYVSENARAIRSAAGKTLYYDGTVKDITDRKYSELALAKFRQAIETSGDTIFLTDTEGLFTYVNPGFTKLYGFSAEEVIGKKTPRILERNVLSEEESERFWDAISAGETIKREHLKMRKDGILVEIESSASVKAQ